MWLTRLCGFRLVLIILPLMSDIFMHLTPEFRAIQKRLGENWDLDYTDIYQQMFEQQKTLSLFSMFDSFLREIPQVRQSEHKQDLSSLLTRFPSLFSLFELSSLLALYQFH